MKCTSWRSKAVGLLAAVFAAACGQVQGPEYAGDPLATLKGQLTANGQVSTQGPIRLALAWYPHWGASSAPKSVMTEEVSYQGSFPMNYTFNITNPPPAEAIADMSDGGGPRRAAMGQLIAYEDLNSNGKLDTIPASGTAIDRILGVSLDFLGTQGFALAYVEQPGGPDADPVAQQLQVGFNLLQIDAPGAAPRIVPLSTSLPIALTADPIFDLYVCEEFFDIDAPPRDTPPCGLRFPGDPDENLAKVLGSLDIENDKAVVRLSVFKDHAPASNAVVTIDGQNVPQDSFGDYFLEGAAGILLKYGHTHVVSATFPGESPMSFNVTMPGDFSIVSPTDGATLTSGQPLSASWTASAGTQDYGIAMYSIDGQFQMLVNETVDGTSFTSADPIDYSGSAVMVVRSMPRLESNIISSVTRTVEVTFAP